MRLFEERVRTEIDAALCSETPFAYLERSGREVFAAARELLESWFARYPGDHAAHLRGRIFSGRETEQRSAWWELYLHESFVRAGYQVTVSSGTPDFTIEGTGGRFHVEATARFEDPSAQSRTRREHVLHDALDRADTGPWCIGLFLLQSGADAAPSGRFRSRIEGWLKTLDFDQVVAAGRQANKNGFLRWPRKFLKDGDWQLEIEAYPVGPVRGEGRRRAICISGGGGMVLVRNEEPLRDAIEKKVRACKGLDAPVIVAVLLAREYGHEHQVESALLGVDACEYEYDPTTLAVADVRAVRTPGGLWSPHDKSASVAGVLAGVRLDMFTLSTIGPTLWTNPLAQRAPLPVAPDLPWQHRWVDDSGRLQVGPIPEPAGFFELAPSYGRTDNDR